MNNNIDDNPIMAQVYANRREISERFGNDPKRYIAAIREMKRRAAEAGMTFLSCPFDPCIDISEYAFNCGGVV